MFSQTNEDSFLKAMDEFNKINRLITDFTRHVYCNIVHDTINAIIH